MQFFFADIGTSGDVVNLQIAIGKNLGRRGEHPLCGCQPSLGHTQTCQQFVNGKWFGEIIIRTGIQCANLISVFITGTDNQDWYIGPGADFLNDIHPIHIRQTKIQQDNVGIMGTDCQKGFVSCGGSHMMIFVHLQCCGNQIADSGVVLYDQNHTVIQEY